MSKQDLLKELFGKFLDDQKMTPAEIRQLQQLVQDERNREQLEQLLASLYQEESREPAAVESNARGAFEEVWSRLQAPASAEVPDEPVVVPLQPRRWWKYVAAAVVLLTVGAGVYWWNTPRQQGPVVQRDQLPTNDVQPGGNKATLTLADGSTIVLDTAQNGTLVLQGNASIQKQEGRLIYAMAQTASNASGTKELPPAYNTIRTPRGGRFHITLPDGSRVWLNAASSLRYPTAFTGETREVTLSGEAYFEVASLPAGRGKTKMPFHVAVNGMQVEVLGTHFNINAYEEEAAMKTTLLEGSVRVNVKSETANVKPNIDDAKGVSPFTFDISRTLSPGQQAIIASPITAAAPIRVQAVNAEDAIAWKNDLIQFEGQDIHAAMRMIARWYDVEVEYKGNLPNVHFRGAIASNVPVSQVLDMMGKTEEVHFTISGRKIIVTP